MLLRRQRLEDRAGGGPPEPEARVLRRYVLDLDRAVGCVQPDPGEVVPAERRAGHDPKAILGEPRDGEIALDPATLVEHLRIGDRADVAGHLVVT